MTEQSLSVWIPGQHNGTFSKRTVWSRLGIAAFLLALLMPASSLGTIAEGSHPGQEEFRDARRINLNLRAGHSFLGLGTVIWPGAPFVSQRHDVMIATQMSWVRVPLMNSFHEADEKPGMSVAQLLAQRSNHPVRSAAEHMSSQQLQSLREEDQRTSERYRSLGEELRAVDISFVMAALPGIPKDWLQTFQYKGTSYKTFMGGQPGQPDHRQDYVNLVVAEILSARRPA